MVETQIVARGIHEPCVIEAMRKVPRHEFVFEKDTREAYEDAPVSIGEGQTISQPYMVALMTEALALKGDDRVLEIGTGSGYQAAVLAQVCREVYSIERIEKLALRAEATLTKLGYANIKIKVADGSLGWPEKIFFDAIIVTAASPALLENLLDQLKDNGRMVVPIGDRGGQTLMVFSKKKEGVNKNEICRCVFVPLIGAYGWQELYD